LPYNKEGHTTAITIMPQRNNIIGIIFRTINSQLDSDFKPLEHLKRQVTYSNCSAC